MNKTSASNWDWRKGATGSSLWKGAAGSCISMTRVEGLFARGKFLLGSTNWHFDLCVAAASGLLSRTGYIESIDRGLIRSRTKRTCLSDGCQHCGCSFIPSVCLSTARASEFEASATVTLNSDVGKGQLQMSSVVICFLGVTNGMIFFFCWVIAMTES